MRTRSFVATGWLNVAVQAGLLGLLYAVGRDRSLEGTGLPREAALLVLVGVPSAIWTAFFYLRDRRRPEPSRYVLAAFLAGMAAAAVFALPVERDLFHTSEWLYRSTSALLLGSVLIRGTLASVLLYLVIRVGFYPSREFDEPVDGLVYGAFAGSGFAAVTSLTYLVGREDFTLFAIGYTAATQILMYASIGALVGYGVGRTKFDRAPSQRSHVAAVLAGAVLAGLYHTAADVAFTTGAPHALWLSFGLTLALSVAVLAAVSILIARLRGRHVTDVSGSATGRGAWVWACALVLLLAGGLAMRAERGDATVASATPAIRFRYSPATLSPRVFAAATAVSPLVPVLWSGAGDEGGPFAVTVAARPERVALPALDALAYVATPAPIDLTLEPVTIGGRAGMRARYAHLETGRGGLGSLPEVVWTYTDIVPSPDYTFVFTLEGRPAGFPRQERVYRRLLDSVQWPAP